MIEQIKIEKGIMDDEPNLHSVNQEEIDRLETAKLNMEKKLKEQERQ